MEHNERQKRFNAQIAGSKGAGYAEIFPDKEVEKFLKENKQNKSASAPSKMENFFKNNSDDK